MYPKVSYNTIHQKLLVVSGKMAYWLKYLLPKHKAWQLVHRTLINAGVVYSGLNIISLTRMQSPQIL